VYWKVINFSSNWNLEIWKNLLKDQRIFVIKNQKKNYWKILNDNIDLKNIWLYNVVQTNIKLKKGDSGSPLFNQKWKLIWIFQVIDDNYSYASILYK
jgi:hypothetical protein